MSHAWSVASAAALAVLLGTVLQTAAVPAPSPVAAPQLSWTTVTVSIPAITSFGVSSLHPKITISHTHSCSYGCTTKTESACAFSFSRSGGDNKNRKAAAAGHPKHKWLNAAATQPTPSFDDDYGSLGEVHNEDLIPPPLMDEDDEIDLVDSGRVGDGGGSGSGHCPDGGGKGKPRFRKPTPSWSLVSITGTHGVRTTSTANHTHSHGFSVAHPSISASFKGTGSHVIEKIWHISEKIVHKIGNKIHQHHRGHHGHKHTQGQCRHCHHHHHHGQRHGYHGHPHRGHPHGGCPGGHCHIVELEQPIEVFNAMSFNATDMNITMVLEAAAVDNTTAAIQNSGAIVAANGTTARDCEDNVTVAGLASWLNPMNDRWRRVAEGLVKFKEKFRIWPKRAHIVYEDNQGKGEEEEVMLDAKDEEGDEAETGEEMEAEEVEGDGEEDEGTAVNDAVEADEEDEEEEGGGGAQVNSGDERSDDNEENEDGDEEEEEDDEDDDEEIENGAKL